MNNKSKSIKKSICIYLVVIIVLSIIQTVLDYFDIISKDYTGINSIIVCILGLLATFIISNEQSSTSREQFENKKITLYLYKNNSNEIVLKIMNVGNSHLNNIKLQIVEDKFFNSIDLSKLINPKCIFENDISFLSIQESMDIRIINLSDIAENLLAFMNLKYKVIIDDIEFEFILSFDKFLIK